MRAVEEWKTYVDMRDLLEDTFQKLDMDKSGTLDKKELKVYLVHLNGGKEVSDTDVNFVFKQADLSKDGTLNKLELMKATCQWFVHIENLERNEKSKMCLVL